MHGMILLEPPQIHTTQRMIMSWFGEYSERNDGKVAFDNTDNLIARWPSTRYWLEGLHFFPHSGEFRIIHQGPHNSCSEFTKRLRASGELAEPNCLECLPLLTPLHCKCSGFPLTRELPLATRLWRNSSHSWGPPWSPLPPLFLAWPDAFAPQTVAELVEDMSMDHSCYQQKNIKEACGSNLSEDCI